MTVTTTPTASATFNRRELAAALARIDGTVNHRSHKAILHGCKISINGHARILATNLELCHNEELGADSRIGEREAVVNTKQLRKAVTSSKAKDIKIELSEDTIVVGSAQLQPMKLDEYPKNSLELEQAEVVASWNGSAKQLCAMLEFCNVATDPDSSRFALGALLLEFLENSKLRIIGTDGRRLHYCSDYEVRTTAPIKTALIPADSIKQACKAISKAETCSIELLKNGRLRIACFDRAGKFAEYSTRQTEGRFPNWDRVFPTNATKLADCEVSELQSVFSQAAGLVNKRSESRGALLEFETAKLAVSHDNEADNCKFELSCNCNGFRDDESNSTFLDVHYMAEAVKYLDKAGAIQARLQNESDVSALFIEASAGSVEYSVLIMPMTR